MKWICTHEWSGGQCGLEVWSAEPKPANGCARHHGREFLRKATDEMPLSDEAQSGSAIP